MGLKIIGGSYLGGEGGISLPNNTDAILENVIATGINGKGLEVRDTTADLMSLFGAKDNSDLELIKEGVKEILSLKKEDREAAIKEPGFIEKYGKGSMDAVGFGAHILKYMDSPFLKSLYDYLVRATS